MVWLVIAAGWIFPFRPQIDLSILPAQMADIPVTPIQPIMNVIPSMADTGGIVNDPATIPLWWALAAIWILGVVSIVLYHALQHGRFMKMVRRWSETVTDLESLGILDSLMSELEIKTQVKLSVCQSITSPMLVGFYRPAILLPPMKIAGDELSLILKHELIHFKRHDLWYKALILAVTALHWFNPVVYLMAKAAAIQCEVSCDALVLRGADFERRKQYGETIIGVVRNGAKLRTALSTNFYGGKKGMKNRISSIMDTKQKRAGVAILCIVLVGILTTGAMLAAAADKEWANGPESKNVTNYVAIAEENVVETPESKTEQSSQEDFESRDIGDISSAQEGMMTPDELAKLYSVYEPFGLTYDKEIDYFYYNGKLVRTFIDILSTNGEPLESGKFKGTMRQLGNPDDKGEVSIKAVRDYTKLNADGEGKLIGIEVAK
jgi:beta-lactamase regulating signal transducer with metallopeptidase domain